MASVISIAPSGAIKQGGILFSFDFGSGGIWSLAICKLNDKKVLFGKYNSGSWTPFSNSILTGSGWLNDSTIKDYASYLVPYALPATETAGMVYESNTAIETGLYADGKGGITTAPVTPKTTQETIAQILTGNTTDVTTTDTTTKKWYEKPLFWVLTAVGTIATILYLKKK